MGPSGEHCRDGAPLLQSNDGSPALAGFQISLAPSEGWKLRSSGKDRQVREENQQALGNYRNSEPLAEF